MFAVGHFVKSSYTFLRTTLFPTESDKMKQHFTSVEFESETGLVIRYILKHNRTFFDCLPKAIKSARKEIKFSGEIGTIPDYPNEKDCANLNHDLRRVWRLGRFQNLAASALFAYIELTAKPILQDEIPQCRIHWTEHVVGAFPDVAGP